MMEEKTIEREVIYEGKVFNVEKHVVSLPNGNTSVRELVYHNGAVAIIAFDEKGDLLVVEQYRKAFEQLSIEIPAGKLEKNEDPVDCAGRELKEETGYAAGELTHVFDFYGAPGFCSERVHIYEATGLTAGERQLDADEFLENQTLTLERALELVGNGTIVDAKTIMAIQHWHIRTLKSF